MAWTYANSAGLFVCTDGHQMKQITDEVTAWLWCAERNGVEVLRNVGRLRGQDWESRLRAWVEEQMAGPVIESVPEVPEPQIDVGILAGSVRDALHGIDDADPTIPEAAVLMAAERGHRRPRKTVLAALRAIAEPTE